MCCGECSAQPDPAVCLCHAADSFCFARKSNKKSPVIIFFTENKMTGGIFMHWSILKKAVPTAVLAHVGAVAVVFAETFIADKSPDPDRIAIVFGIAALACGSLTCGFLSFAASAGAGDALLASLMYNIPLAVLSFAIGGEHAEMSVPVRMAAFFASAGLAFVLPMLLPKKTTGGRKRNARRIARSYSGGRNYHSI